MGLLGRLTARLEPDMSRTSCSSCSVIGQPRHSTHWGLHTLCLYTLGRSGTCRVISRPLVIFIFTVVYYSHQIANGPNAVVLSQAFTFSVVFID